MVGTALATRTVRKASSVVMARLGGEPLQVLDHQIFTYLLARCYDEIEPGREHCLPVQDVLEYARLDRVGKLQSCLERLGRCTVEIDYEEASGEGRSILAHFLSYDISRTERGLLHFAFDPILARFLRDPKVYAAVSPDRTRDFGNIASFRLYEVMKLQYNKKVARQAFTVVELREYFQVGAAHARMDNFKSKVVERAVDEVNAIAEFHVTVDYVRGGQGGGIVGIEFEALPKSHARLLETREIRSVGRKARARPADTRTIDLLDGKSFEERGVPADLQQSTIDEARLRMGEDDDVEHLVSAWRETVRGRLIRDPDAMFLDWLKMRQDKASDPLLRDIDADVFGAILGGE